MLRNSKRTHYCSSILNLGFSRNHRFIKIQEINQFRCFIEIFLIQSHLQSFDNSSNRVFKKPSTASEKSIPFLSERTASHQTHSPIFAGRMAWSSLGHLPSLSIIWRPTRSASVKKARASSSVVHSFPWSCRSKAWYFLPLLLPSRFREG